MAESESYYKLKNGLEAIRAGLGELIDILSTDGGSSDRRVQEVEPREETEADFFEQLAQSNQLPVSDDMYHEVIKTITGMGYASTLVLQTQLDINYRQAVSIMAELERNGLVAPAHGFRPHKVLPNAYALRDCIDERLNGTNN
ncbi:MAG: hypothetical protein L0229_06370 [Blastocatellia bacterium]|nr:hypothetical protein [Blastocatellia bacterium]